MEYDRPQPSTAEQEQPDVVSLALPLGKFVTEQASLEHGGYGDCVVCGQDMPVNSDPHTYSEFEECHAECCPECNYPVTAVYNSPRLVLTGTRS